MEWKKARWAVLDVETTGLDPQKDRVVELACAVFESGKVAAGLAWRVNPGMPIPAEASAIHGVDDAAVAEAPPMEEVMVELMGFMATHAAMVPVAYNAKFDRSFIRNEFARAGHWNQWLHPCLGPVAWVDPLVWVRHLDKYAKGKKLVDVCRRMKVPLEDAHSALADATATGHVLWKMRKRLPDTWRELGRMQGRLQREQEADYQAWLKRKQAEDARQARFRYPHNREEATDGQ